jgi:hypothetical protein
LNKTIITNNQLATAYNVKFAIHPEPFADLYPFAQDEKFKFMPVSIEQCSESRQY